jgi:hypothetical protein
MDPITGGIGAVLSIGSSLFGRSSAKRAARRAEAQARARQAAIQGYGRDALGRSQAMAAQQPTGFTPWNVRTGFGGWNIDPATGQATAEMDPTAKGFQDWAYGQSQEARNQLGNFDRQAFAQQEYNRGQGLLQEGRDADLSNLLGSMQRKGLVGFGQTPVGGTSTSQSNPMLNSLFDRQNRQNLELMDRSFASGDRQMDRLSQRATGLFDTGYGMNDDLNNQLQMNMQFGEADRSRALQDWQNMRMSGADQEQYYRLAALGGMEDVGNAQTMGNQARLGSNMGLAQIGSNMGGMMMSGGGFGGFNTAGLESGFSSMFGGPRAPSMYTASRTPSYWNPEF